MERFEIASSDKSAAFKNSPTYYAASISSPAFSTRCQPGYGRNDVLDVRFANLRNRILVKKFHSYGRRSVVCHPWNRLLTHFLEVAPCDHGRPSAMYIHRIAWKVSVRFVLFLSDWNPSLPGSCITQQVSDFPRMNTYLSCHGTVSRNTTFPVPPLAFSKSRKSVASAGFFFVSKGMLQCF